MPLTAHINKHLLPVYNRAMVEYPLATLRASGVEEILIVTNTAHIPQFEAYFSERESGHGISYAVQSDSLGIAHALLSAESFAQGAGVTVVLGDNIFDQRIRVAPSAIERAHIWTKKVQDPSRFGVLSSSEGSRRMIEEKPAHPQSHDAVVGMYQYPADVFNEIRALRPSARGEYEITDLSNRYLAADRCDHANVPDDFFWCDAGTFDSLLEAGNWAAGQTGDIYT